MEIIFIQNSKSFMQQKNKFLKNSSHKDWMASDKIIQKQSPRNAFNFFKKNPIFYIRFYILEPYI